MLKKRKNSEKNRNLSFLQRLRYPFLSIFLTLATIGIIYGLIHFSNHEFRLKDVCLKGNKHLSDEELKVIAGIKGNENLLAISTRRMYERIIQSPWVRTVSIRKEYPDRIQILIKEAEPFALLDMRGRLFIVDDNGKMLEELKDKSAYFLPVIFSNPFQAKDAYIEAIRLAGVIKKTGMLSKKERIEIIAYKLNEITVNLDGVVVKLGAGEYEDKLARLADIEEEVIARKIPVDYIDIRFRNKVVVKPINEVVK